MRIQLDPANEQILGLWTDVRSAPDVAYAAPTDVPAVEEVTWEVVLPTDPVSTTAALVAAHGDLDRARGALGEVPARLEDWVAEPWRTDAEIAFGVVAERPTRADTTDATASLTRLVRATAPVAWVETRIDDQLVARGRTTLGGATSVVVLDGAPQHLARHAEALDLAMRSRLVALETVATVVRAVLAVTARLGLPGGPVLALPLVWRLVRRLIGAHTERRERRGC